MDNLSSPKGPRVAKLIDAAGGRVLFLPPYPPDLHPIEPALSKIKQALRRLATRTQAGRWEAMWGVLDRVGSDDALSSDDARGYF